MHCLSARKESDSNNYSKANRLAEELILWIKNRTKIVQQLRQLIKIEKIQVGEKSPSERVLSECLGVGQSSVREALRSVELLGLIETRHGEGSFLASTKAAAPRNIVDVYIRR